MTAPTSDAPVVPPANPRPTTATQKADLALDRLDDLERTLAAGAPSVDGATATVRFDEDAQAAYDNLRSALDQTNRKLAELDKGIETNLAGDVDTLKQGGTVNTEKISALDVDLSALADAFNGLAGRVDALQPDALEKLREDISSTLAELRANTVEVVSGDVAKLNREQDELDKDVQHLREEQGSYGRALDALLGRVQAVENRAIGVTGEVVTLEDSTPRGALRKFLALMNAVDSLGKDKTADVKMGGYAFRSIDAAMDAVGHGMRSVGLIMRSEVTSHSETKTVIGERVWTSVVARMRYVFVDPGDGSEHAIEMVGEGRDMGDKATSKAVSMALKYGLLQSLCIPFNAPESDGETTPPIERPAQQQQAQRPAQQQQAAPEPPDDTPSREELQASVEDEQNAQALRAVQAIDALGQLFPHDQPTRLQAIEKRCRELNIGSVVIRGSTVAQHVLGARATLPTPDGGW